ncbi:radical SAM protein [Candidatus Woesearchaeota archaeon]|nr:radical SAM protein [Candidatus Woesearchaeota archaeon]
MTNEPQSTQFSLEQGVHLVTGSVNAALYDTNTGDIFSVDRTNRILLEMLLMNWQLREEQRREEQNREGQSREEQPENGQSEASKQFLDASNGTLQKLLQNLEENKLGRFFSAEEMPQHKLPEKPEINIDFIWFELTQGCNLKCQHCYDSSSPDLIKGDIIKGDICSGGSGRGKEGLDGIVSGEAVSSQVVSSKTNEKSKQQLGVLSHETWLDLLDQTAELGVKSIQFIGGEPLLYDRIFDLIRHAKEKEIKFIELFTNGTLITPQIADELSRLSVNVALSLYADTPEIHDKVTQKPGSFEKTTTAIKLLQERKVSVRLAVIAMSTNEGSIDATLEYIKKEFGIEHTRYDIVRPVGRGGNDELVPKALYEKSITRAANFRKVNADAFARNLYGNSCLNGKLCITPTGDVHPCIMEKEYKIGNVKEKSLKEIAQSEELGYIFGLSKDYIEGCSECEYRYACHDCRPKAKSQDNFLAKPKECRYEPTKGVWQS